MLKLQRTPALLASSLGLVIACCLSSVAHATLATGVYVSSAEPAAAVDSYAGADVWTVAAIPGLGAPFGTDNGHDSSTANGVGASSGGI
ncbi:MAG: hypothetical protein GXP24_11580, partial [Planctomycetes bacterium]|nr:hypothetical protein [Planctomycetota bacterium]